MRTTICWRRSALAEIGEGGDWGGGLRLKGREAKRDGRARRSYRKSDGRWQVRGYMGEGV